MADVQGSANEQPQTYRASKLLWQYGLPLLPFVLLVIVLTYGLGRDPSLVPSPFLGKPLPSFSAVTLDGDSQELVASSQMEGKVWMLNIWASWCPPCLQEHPQIVWLARNNLPVVGINYKDKRDDALLWLKDNGNPFEFSFVDEQGAIGIDLGVYGVPESFLIDANGIVLRKHVGPMFASDAKEMLEAANKAGLARKQ